MSHFYATYFVLIYSVFIVCTDGLNVKRAHTRLIRESLQNDLRNHRNHSPNIWGKNQTSLFVQENKELSEGWIAVENWPNDSFKLGQVSGVSLDAKGHVYVFHRGDRVWDLNTFDINNKITLNERHRGPISIPTVIIYDSVTGKVLQKWGENMFYMPHGITVDRDDNIWATDVALHQVFKYSPLKSNPGTAQLTLGEAFVPGNDAAHFCKPTSIAVTSWGDFFVADGYCNSRIIKFDKNGVKTIEWGRSNTYSGIGQPPDYMFNVPHALMLAEDKGMLCVADRENGRVQCFNVHNSTIISKFNSPCVGARLFSVAYSPVQGGLFFVVNGMEERQFSAPIRGCVLSAKSDKDLYKFGENKLQNPHDIAVSPDGKTLFVVEIGPFKLWKYQSNDVVNNFLSENNVSVSSVQSVYPSEQLNSVQSPDEPQQLSAMTPSGILPAILVTSAALIFAGALLTAAIVYSRARRRGRTLIEENYALETKKLVTDDY